MIYKTNNKINKINNRISIINIKLIYMITNMSININ